MAPDVRATSDVTSIVGNYYDKTMLERLVSRAIVYNLAEKRPMPKGISTTINMNRFTNFPTVTSKITEGEVPTQTYLSGTAVTATIFQLGAWTPVSDLLELTSFSNVIKECVENFGDSAATSVDTWIYWSLMSETASESPANYFGGSDVGISTWFNAKQGGLSSIFISADGYTFSAWGGALQNYLSVPGNATLDGYGLDLDKVNRLVSKLRANDVRPFADGFYKMVLHPKQVANVIRTTEWANWNQYVRPEVLDKGELGRAYGVRFYESTIVPMFYTGQISQYLALCAYFAPIWGQGAFAVTEIDTEKGVKTYVKAPNKFDTSNPLNQWSTIGWKISMAAKTLNPKCGYFLATLG